MENRTLEINTNLVHKLIATQFPEWKNLPINPVPESGWDNRTFHLGDKMLVRMPSDTPYASQVEKEQYWLPKLSPFLPLPIPTPIAIGNPGFGYPFHWSINQWLAGEPASTKNISNMNDFAFDLAKFLKALQQIDTTGGPKAGDHNFYRGGSLSVYEDQTKKALALLRDTIDFCAATKIWDNALKTAWNNNPVWIHGDIAAGNLLIQEGKLSAVIDFGQLAIGDPACDLAIAWTFLDKESRTIFRKALSLNDDTWERGRAWALWKALIVAANLIDSPAKESSASLKIINTIIHP